MEKTNNVITGADGEKTPNNRIEGIANEQKSSFVELSHSQNEKKLSIWKFWQKKRHVVAVLGFFGFFVAYILRVNLSIAIVAMNSEHVIINETGHEVIVREFDWDSTMQGYILSSFFYGYICTQFLGGWLAARIGGKRVFGFGIAMTSFFTAITPPIARWSSSMFVTVRIIEGFFEGLAPPCIHAIWANSAPPLERTKLATFTISGCYVGTVFAMPVCGMMAERLGWASIFYVFGIIGIVWFVFWSYYITDKPEDDPLISQAELAYIRKSLGDTKEEKITHPWKSIFTSAPVWAIIAAHFAENWGFYTMLTQLPTYMNDVLHFEIEKSGWFSAMPYLLMSVVLQIAGQLADYFRTKGLLSTTQVRKIFNCGAFLCQTIFMTMAAFLQTPTEVITCIIMAVGLGGFALCGYSVNYLDIAPQHASVILGIGNTIGTLPGILSPIITGHVVQQKSAAEWRVVFILTGAINLVGALVYGFFASGERQSWAADENEKKPSNAYDNEALEG